LSVAVAIFAHNEARRIDACLSSLPLVNGSSDGTADIGRAWAARYPGLTVHDWQEGGKSRTWNRLVHDTLENVPDALVCMDGDAEIAPGSIDALVGALAANPAANAVAGLPLNGRSHRAYQEQLRNEGGLFGDLYALRGTFVERMRTSAIRLPDDLIGDDGLIAALAMTDLGRDADWNRARIAVAENAGFRCEQTDMLSPVTWAIQYRRMINYAERHFQNQIISDVMQRDGATGLPEMLSPLYVEWLPHFTPRSGIANAWFDRVALARMATKAAAG
jgi:glycosyltransferase involved in cell wall biosynthesis